MLAWAVRRGDVGIGEAWLVLEEGPHQRSRRVVDTFEWLAAELSRAS